MEDDQFYETMSGERILTMTKKSTATVLVLTENYETRILDPILSKVQAGLSSLYVEEIPEWQRANIGETFSPRR